MIGTKQQLAKVQLNSISIGQCETTHTSSVGNLGVWFDSTLSMNSHINKTCSLAFYYLYNIRKIRKYLPRETTEKLIHALFSSRIDYCNSLLFGLLAYQIHNIHYCCVNYFSNCISNYYKLAQMKMTQLIFALYKWNKLLIWITDGLQTVLHFD